MNRERGMGREGGGREKGEQRGREREGRESVCMCLVGGNGGGGGGGGHVTRAYASVVRVKMVTTMSVNCA